MCIRNATKRCSDNFGPLDRVADLHGRRALRSASSSRLVVPMFWLSTRPSTFLDFGSLMNCPKTLFPRQHCQVSGADLNPSSSSSHILILSLYIWHYGGPCSDVYHLGHSKKSLHWTDMCVVLESGVLLESSRVTTGLQFPTVNSLRGTTWQNIRDRATLPRNTLLQLMRAQSGGLSCIQRIIWYYKFIVILGRRREGWMCLAALGLNLVVVAVLRDSVCISRCPAWQIVVRLSVVS